MGHLNSRDNIDILAPAFQHDPEHDDHLVIRFVILRYQRAFWNT